MRLKFWAAVLWLAILAGDVSAHPGHSPTDVAAQVSQPWAGADHLVAFLALTLLLLMALRFSLNLRAGRRQRVRK